MSLRTRLALFIALAIAAALLTQGVFGYLSFRQQAYASLDRTLRLYLTQLQTSQRERGPRGGSRDAPILKELFEGYVVRARVVGEGQVVAQTDDFPADVPVEFASKPKTYGSWRVGSVAVRSGPPGFRESAAQGPPENYIQDYIQGAVSSYELLESLSRYRRTLLITVLGVSALGALASLLLSRPALRPLQHLLATAQRVADLGRLVPARAPSGRAGNWAN